MAVTKYYKYKQMVFLQQEKQGFSEEFLYRFFV